jgi:hypothetical protein
MGPLIMLLLLALVPLNGLTLWVFLRYTPAGDTPRRRHLFNCITFALAPVVCAIFSLWLSTELTPHVEEQWLPAMSAIGWITAFPTVLALATLLRFYLQIRRDDGENADGAAA